MTEEKKIYTHDEAIKAIAEGKELAELRGLNEATIDFIYAFSALHYKNEKYEDALIGFRFLCRHKHRDPDMWIALARTLFAKGEQKEALKTYLMAATLRPTAALCLEIARAFFAQEMIEQTKIFLAAAKRVLETHGQGQRLEPELLALEREVLGQ